MYVLGVNLSHDRSACLMADDGRIVAVGEERLDRVKHSCPQDALGRWFALVPERAIDYCLQAFGLGREDLDAVVFNNAAVIGGTVLRNLTVADCALQGSWAPGTRMATMNHHLAHALSAFGPSGFAEAAVLVIDKGGSVVDHWTDPDGHRVPLLERASIYRAGPDGLELVLRVQDRPGPLFWNCNSLGALYELATLHAGYTPFDAGKTMGLAPHGSTRLAEALRRHVVLDDAGYQISPAAQSVGLNLVPRAQQRMLGPVNLDPERPSQQTAAVARAAQEVVNETVCHLARLALQRTGARNLCIAGGVGLNCVANSFLRARLDLDGVFVQPAATDDGTAIGAALYGLERFGGVRPRLAPWSANLGRRYDADACSAAVRADPEFQARFAAVPEAPPETVAQLIADGLVVGWFEGGSEFGPRALGHRSLLADPRRHRMRAYLNGTVKRREHYRPYGASVLAERVGDYFEPAAEEPFMLFVARVRGDRQASIPSAVHLDGTCRIQTVRRDREPVYHALISAFARLTGVPLVLNTSFNGKGEPIVETPADAVASAARMGLDALALEGRLYLDRRRALPASAPAAAAAQ